ncbi:hypothetical protein [Pseudonocardia autotrophica]|uniref:hypothetical protein n=1 Tax=Pseudonocardia autotrophica TaxID=2074 RepID=UPI0010608308|nr:hypothetical protein [Pseudonocardia autotrophica]
MIEIWRKLHADGQRPLPEWDWLFELGCGRAARTHDPGGPGRGAVLDRGLRLDPRQDLLMPTSSPPITTGLRTDWIVEPD